MIRLATLILLIVFLLRSSPVFAQEENGNELKKLPVNEYKHCFNGVGFFQVDKKQLGERLPENFTPQDGTILGKIHEGSALLAIIYYSCPQSDSTNKSWS